jgi:hypothetical protein
MITRPLFALGVTALAVTVASCSSGKESHPGTTPAAGSTWSVTVQPLTPPAEGSSSTPQLTSSGKGLIASWIERSGDKASLKFSERTADGWSAPKTVASGAGWFLSWADAPTVMRMSNGTLVADWFVTTREEVEGYDTLMTYSKDEGRTWAAPFKPHRDKTKTQHGFTTFVEMPDKGLGVIWLDARDQENNTTDPEGGVVTLRFTSFDPAWKQAADVEVNKRVCECCQTAATITADGVIAAFRDRSEKEIRDIAVTRFENGKWSDAQIVNPDNWEVDSCPVNGPALSARGREVAVAWFSAKDDQGHAYAAFSHDAGRTWTAPVRLDEKRSVGHVDIELLDDGGAAASWVEFADQRQRFTMRRVDPSGAMSAPIVIGGDGPGRVSGYPRMARTGDELVFAWTESAAGSEDGESGQQIKGAVARLPRTTAP